LNVDTNKKIVCSCGSGVTASVIYLALQKLGIKDVGLYDGSWSEYASEPGKVEIWTGNNWIKINYKNIFIKTFGIPYNEKINWKCKKQKILIKEDWYENILKFIPSLEFIPSQNP